MRWQCLKCRKVSTNAEECPFCGGTERRMHKTCNGRLHKGAYVPLEQFSIVMSEGREYRPHSKCKPCRSIERRKAAPIAVYFPVLTYIKKQGLTQRQISKLMGCNENTVSDWALKKRKYMHMDCFVALLNLRNELYVKNNNMEFRTSWVT